MDKREVERAYDRVAPWFDLVEGIPDHLLGVRRLRSRILSHARGRVLEVAAGTGKNFPHYGPDCRLTVTDLSRRMLERYRRRLEASGRNASLLRMDTEELAFPDGVFDTVVDSMALCTYPAPLVALREMSRVCRAGGRILLVEHGRSRWPVLAGFQDRHEDFLAEPLGCRWNRDPERLADEAGLDVRSVERTVLGVFYGIVAAPAGGGRAASRQLPSTASTTSST